ncbi:MAG: hypothetical protein ACR2NH_05160 [Solirubrobacteraceae bacterium]
MTVDHDAPRAGLEAAIPFKTHLGLRTVEVGEGIGRALSAVRWHVWATG